VLVFGRLIPGSEGFGNTNGRHTSLANFLPSVGPLPGP